MLKKNIKLISVFRVLDLSEIITSNSSENCRGLESNAYDQYT